MLYKVQYFNYTNLFPEELKECVHSVQAKSVGGVADIHGLVSRVKLALEVQICFR